MLGHATDTQGPERRRNIGRRLTDRQAVLLAYVADGLENKEIARLLGIAEQSVKDQISNLLRRLAVHNRAALAGIATEVRIFGTTIDETWSEDLFTNAPLGIALMRGPEHRIEVANEYLRRQAGDPDVVGLTLREAFPGLGSETHAIFDRVYESGEAFAAHEHAARWDRSGQGTEVGYRDFVIHPLRDGKGRVNGLLAMYLDVTDVVRGRRGQS